VKDLPAGLEDRIAAWGETFPKFMDDLHGLLTENRIWKQRLVDIGIMSAEQALAWGFAGPCLRASGVLLTSRAFLHCIDLRGLMSPHGALASLRGWHAATS
jgi:NADH:ubiquinone oxidoreductase subunit D